MGTFYSELMKGLGASTRLFQLMDREPQIPLNSEWALEQVISNPIVHWRCPGGFVNVQFLIL